MLETISLRQTYDHKKYKQQEEELRIKLFNLQQECEKQKLAVLVNIAGVDNSGRGETVNLLSSWLDQKKLRSHTFWRQTDDESLRPESWRYWMRLPKHGEFALFLGGWYGEAIRKASFGDIDKDELYRIMHKNLDREQMLTDDNTVIIKFWLHLDEKEYKKRSVKRKKDIGQYHFTPYEKKSEKRYKELVDTVSQVIPMTDKSYAPWYIIDAYDADFRNLSIVKALIETIELALEQKAEKEKANKNKADVVHENKTISACVPVLDRIDLSQSLEKQEYQDKLEELQNEIFQLTYKAYKKGISSTLIFEGWDAGGKGGAIRRVASSIDARITRVIPIGVPTDEEIAHQYLWRFWRYLPMEGHVTIYDRSWYGRVLVERIEGLTPQEDWKRAYSEINSFEEELVENKNILLKFWLQISPDEQLRRFREREEVEWKHYKITPDDWRNREKADAYKIAADEMFMRTDTKHAPWHIIAGESKYFARIEILKHFKKALLNALSDKKEDIVSDNDKNLQSVKEVKAKKAKNK